jgi:hypothetical protein
MGLLLALGVSTVAVQAQQFVQPTIPGSAGQQVLQVGPDGVVHLDGPMVAQDGIYLDPGQTYAGPPATRQYPWWRPFAKDWDAMGSMLFDCPVPPHYRHRHGFWGDFIYLRPRDADVAFAVPIDGPVTPVPVGPTGVVDPDFEPGFRTGLNLRLNDGASLAVAYTYLRAETRAASSIDAVVGELRPLTTHPGAANVLSDVQEANARLDLDQDLLDIQFRGMLTGSESNCERCADATHYLLGVRLAQLDQAFGANYIVTGTTTVNSAVEFRGAGLSFGLESERHNNDLGVFLYGRGVMHLLAGEFDAAYRQQNTFGQTEAFTSWSAARIVPVLETELGMGWTGPARHVRISGGYLIAAWFNMVKTDEFIGAAQLFDFNGMSDVLTFDGLVARAEWRF